MARAAVGADDALMFGFFENIHDRAKTRGPVGFGEAMHQEQIDVVDAEFAAKAVNVRAHFFGFARPGFGEDGHFAAVHVLESFADVWMAAVRIGSVEETQALVVAIQEQTREAIDAESALVRGMPGADGAGAHRQATGDDAGAAERDRISGGNFSSYGGEGKKALRQGVRGESRGSDPARGMVKKSSTAHRDLTKNAWYVALDVESAGTAGTQNKF
jgi:hypothetical protein